MKLSVYEQSQIPVRPRADEERHCISQEQASGLVDLGEKMGARVASWNSPGAIRTHQFVGVVRQGDLQLEILPKLDGLSEPSQVRKNLLAMLATTQSLDVRASEVVGYLESSEPFICALARLYCNRLLEAVRKGLRQDYVYFGELLPHIRGKVDWPAQARLQVTQRLDFHCLFDERSNDTPLNRTLKSALLTANTLLEGSRVSRVVNEIRNAMDEIADICPPPEQMARLRTDRMNRNLEPLLALAKLLLGNRNPDLGRSTRGSHDTFAIVWDMNVLFEEYVGRVTEDVLLPKGFSVDLQEDAAAYLASEAKSQKKAFLLRPDILVRHRRKPVVVADTKWKRLDPSQSNLGVAPSDAYQVLAYANRYETDLAVLVYPHHPALGIPGLRGEFQIRGTFSRNVSIRVVTLDLSMLDCVSGQVEQGLRIEVHEGDQQGTPSARPGPRPERERRATSP